MQSDGFYLVVRPLSEDPVRAEDSLSALSGITGLDVLTLRQRVIGAALRILKFGDDPSPLRDMAEALIEIGCPAVVLSKAQVTARTRPVKVTALELGNRVLRLIDRNNDVVLSLDRARECLVVLATLEPAGIQRKRMTRLILGGGRPFSLTDRLHYIFHRSPIMDIYPAGSDVPFRIDSGKFNYHSLEEDNCHAAAVNFPFMIGQIREHSAGTLLDTGFGESDLPFLALLNLRPGGGSLPRENIVDGFAVYSRFVHLAHQGGIFDASCPTLPSGVPSWEQMEGISWAGPVSDPLSEDPEQEADQDDKAGLVSESSLPAPEGPEGDATRPGSWNFQRPEYGRAGEFLRTYKRFVRLLGPRFLFYPLTLTAFASAALAYFLKKPEPAAVTAICLGLILFCHSFVLMQRKRAIENCPTARIGSLPMGGVEVKGHARQKQPLKSPYSYTDCVYYAYEIQSLEPGGRRALRGRGDSGPVPFYLEDETGKVLILPQGAIVRAGVTQTLYGMPGMNPQNILFNVPENTKIIEKIIPVGGFLFVTGFARPQRTSGKERKRLLTEKLRLLKMNPVRLKKYDRNGDGRIDGLEWEAARRDLEEETLIEGMATAGLGDSDRVAIGPHPSGGLFYISDKKEKMITRSMVWRMTGFFVLGPGCTLGGLYFLLKAVVS